MDLDRSPKEKAPNGAVRKDDSPAQVAHVNEDWWLNLTWWSSQTTMCMVFLTAMCLIQSLLLAQVAGDGKIQDIASDAPR